MADDDPPPPREKQEWALPMIPEADVDKILKGIPAYDEHVARVTARKLAARDRETGRLSAESVAHLNAIPRWPPKDEAYRKAVDEAKLRLAEPYLGFGALFRDIPSMSDGMIKACIAQMMGRPDGRTAIVRCITEFSRECSLLPPCETHGRRWGCPECDKSSSGEE